MARRRVRALNRMGHTAHLRQAKDRRGFVVAYTLTIVKDLTWNRRAAGLPTQAAQGGEVSK